MDGGQQTADGSRTGFRACRERRTVNEWGTNQRMETADRRRQTAEQATDANDREWDGR